MRAIRHPRALHRRHRARGSLLLVAMIMLLSAALLTATALRGSLTSTQAIGNMQWRSEAVAAANEGLDRLLSSADFATKALVVTEQVNKAPFQVDINGDGVNDIAVSFPEVTLDGVTRAGPRCLRTEPIPNASLDPELAADLGCFNSSGSEGSGLATEGDGGAAVALAPPPSLCSNTAWSIRMRATDAVTNTTVDLVQGVSVRVGTDVANNLCL